jgi:protoporphyrinogen oxidase
MDKYDIVIFGGGIAGLTVAHELSKYNLKIAVIEKESIIGGMSRSDVYKSRNNLRTEHSWRGFGPFYKNTFQIMKEIKLDSTKTTFDTLIPYINFNTLEKNLNPNKNITFYDIIILLYWIIFSMVSGYKRSEKNKELSFNTLVSNKISENARKKYIESIGPGIGLDPYSSK